METLVSACIFQARIEMGYIDPRDLEQVEPLNAFMHEHGNELFDINLELYAILLGFMKQVRLYNPSDKVYSEFDFTRKHSIN